MTEPLPKPRRLGPRDILRLGMHGMRTRPLRAALSALGIAIGVAAMVAVVSIPASSQQAVREQIAALGSNLLTAQAGQNFDGTPTSLAPEAVPMVRRIGPVTSTTAIGDTKEQVRRSDKIPAEQQGGGVLAVTPDLLDVLHGEMYSGKFLDKVTSQFPTVVLGSVTARQLGIELTPGAPPPQVWIGGQWFTVVGVLAALPLAPEIERSALVGWPVAQAKLGFDGNPTKIFVRSADSEVEPVRAVLGPTIKPDRPGVVQVSRPSEALAAQRIAESSFNALFLGLGGVALLVGGIGVANTMVIAVLERRREIGLRRALGATKRQVRGQFLTESVWLSGLGGAIGVLLGMAATAAYSISQHWPAVFPPLALAGGVGIAIVLGVLAGVYPAMRAARLTPTTALA
jgi:putative ABC transport system permease protein